MEKKTYNYSTKNIPTPSERNYKLQLVEKIEIFIKRMRWKAIMYDTGCKQNVNVEKYGLKTLHSPKQVKELSAFEKDLIAVVKEIKFGNARSDFQTTLQEDIRSTHNSKKTMTFADKISNMYQLTKEEHTAITSKYKKTNKKIKYRINRKGKEILKNKEALHLLDINEARNSFFMLKDHKENLQNNPTVRLTNPGKKEIGRISKAILGKINSSLIKQSKANQWKNTQNVIEWFMKIEKKSKYKFIVFDIKDFYSSIKKALLIKAINFAEKLANITNGDKVIIKHTGKSLLYDKSESWMKKDSGLFDVTMSVYDGAEVCKLVRTFLLYKLSLKYNKDNIGLYRDDGLAIFKNISGPKSEKVKKDIQKLFKENELDIVIQCNMKMINHLNVTLNLENSTYRSYQKENNQMKYIHFESSHPPSIIKQLPLSIESRLSSLSCSKKFFQ